MSARRRRHVISSLVVVAFAIWAAIQYWWSWAPDILGRLSVGFAVAAGLEILVGTAGRSSTRAAAVATFGWVLLLAATFVGVWFLPSPGRAAFCSAPDTYCEDGLVFYVLPPLGLLAAIASGAAGSLLTWLRCRIAPRIGAAEP